MLVLMRVDQTPSWKHPQISFGSNTGDKHILIGSNHHGKNTAEANTKEAHFALAKAWAIANSQGEIHRLQDQTKQYAKKNSLVSHTVNGPVTCKYLLV